MLANWHHRFLQTRRFARKIEYANDRFGEKQTFGHLTENFLNPEAAERPVFPRKQPLSYYWFEGPLMTHSRRCARRASFLCRLGIWD